MKTKSFRSGTELTKVRSELRGGRLHAEFEGEQPELMGQLLRTGEHEAIFESDGKRHRIAAAADGDTVWASVDGRVFRFERVDESGPGGALAAENVVAAPMPGKVTKLLAAEGDQVEEGAALVVVEAMKMEHTLRAPMAGRISVIRCAEGEQVAANLPLVEIEVEEA